MNNNQLLDYYILFNKYYQPDNKMNEENTYKYCLAMNHRDITNRDDYEYFVRCIRYSILSIRYFVRYIKCFIKV